jgi:nicotinamidase-related amidase
MTSTPVRNPLAGHLLTPPNAALLFIGDQPAQLAAVRSLDHALLMNNAVWAVRAHKAVGVPVVYWTVNVGGPGAGQTRGRPAVHGE